ncbi:hypothetical protein [Ruminococcus sp.]|nr:hypothetical protein [Ruminococcus sp.]
MVEAASFDIQKINNPDIQGTDYQQGEQLNFLKYQRVCVIQRWSYLPVL